MSDVLHRTTGQFKQSVNTPDFDPLDWIINPDLSAVVGFLPKYWKQALDVVSLMTQTERDTVDADITAIQEQNEKDSEKLRIDDERVLSAFAKVVMDEINILRQQFNLTTSESNQLTDTAFPDRTLAQLKTAIKNEIQNI